MGSPAKAVRTLTAEEIDAQVSDNGRRYVSYSHDFIAMGLGSKGDLKDK